jgi:hypothetical protein
MSDVFTEADVTAGAEALMTFWQKGGLTHTELQAVEVIVAAVAPQIAERAILNESEWFRNTPQADLTGRVVADILLLHSRVVEVKNL